MKKFPVIFKIILLLLCNFEITLVASEAKADINLCIAQFPCHLKTGKLLPGFLPNTPCAWENICNNYRNSRKFKEVNNKLALIKKQNKRKKA